MMRLRDLRIARTALGYLVGVVGCLALLILARMSRHRNPRSAEPRRALGRLASVDSDTLVWLFERTEKLADALQGSIIRQAVVVGAAGGYLIDSQLREGVADLLNLSASDQANGRSPLFEAVIPILLGYLFVSMGYVLGLYLISREDFRREALLGPWTERPRLPYQNTSLVFLAAAFLNTEDRTWELFSGLAQRERRPEGIRRVPGAVLILWLPYVALFTFVGSIWVIGNAFIGFFVAGPIWGNEGSQILVYAAVMTAILLFYGQFLTSSQLNLGRFAWLALGGYAAAAVFGFLLLEYPPSWIIDLT